MIQPTNKADAVAARDALACDFWEIFTCYPAQKLFVNGSSRVNQLFLGGRGTGKSYALCLKALYLALRNGGTQDKDRRNFVPGAIMGRTSREINDKLEPYLLEHLATFKEKTGINLLQSYSGKHQRYTLINGAQIHKISYGRADSLRKARGYTLAWAVMDEIEHAEVYSKAAWEIVSATLRHPLAREQILACATTPDGLRGLTAFFVKMIRGGHPDFYAQTATVFDNPFVDDIFRRRLQEGCSPRMWEQEGLGKILRPTEVVFGQYDPVRHVVKTAWRHDTLIVVGIDWGEAHAYYCAIQVDKMSGKWEVMTERKVEDSSRPQFRRIVKDEIAALPRMPYMIAADRAVKSENNWLRGAYSDQVEGGIRTCKSKEHQRVMWGVGAISYMLEPGDAPCKLYMSDELSGHLEMAGRGLRGAFINYRFRKSRNQWGEYTVTNTPESNTASCHPLDALRYAVTCGAYDENLHGGKPLAYAIAHGEADAPTSGRS